MEISYHVLLFHQMAFDDTNQLIASLRLINSRLSTTPSWQLPQLVPHLARSINACGSIFSVASGCAAKDTSDSAALVHKIKTRISTLLQEKSPQARWAAVALVKAVIESGDLEVLQASNAWIRYMVGILGRPDPAATKKLCIVTLTRCFLLSHSHLSIVRELTTPVLPAFLAACLKILKGPFAPDESLLLVTLQSLNELLPYHPASFRPYQAHIRSCILPMLASTPSSSQQAQGDLRETKTSYTEVVANSARRCFVLLLGCDPKRAEADEWSKVIHLLCQTIHATADRVFRALIEDQASLEVRGPLQSAAETVSSSTADPMDLPSWTGIQGGIERLVGLLSTLQAFLATSTNSPSPIPVGIIVRIFNRLMSVFPPSGGGRIKPQIARDEREGLVHGLPYIHARVIDLISSLIERTRQGAVSFHGEFLEPCLWVLDLEKPNLELRTAVYNFVHRSIMQLSLSFPYSLRSPLSNCLILCCEDLAPLEKKPEYGRSGMPRETHRSVTGGANQASAHAYVKSTPIQADRKPSQTEIQFIATKLIAAALVYLPNGFLFRAVRVRMDRTAISAGGENMLVASVLYPSTTGQGYRSSTSLLPFLTRAYPNSSHGEALMKPRMPLIQLWQSILEHNGRLGEAQETEEPMYNHLYSGSGITSFEVTERRSMVVDSTQADTETREETIPPASHDYISQTYSQPQTGAVSIEVPETQPTFLSCGSKRGRDDILGSDVATDRLYAEFEQAQPPSIEEPEAKRPQLAEASTGALAPQNPMAQTRDATIMEELLPAEVPKTSGLSKDESSSLALDSDSDDSPLPQIDPTLSTDEEDVEDEDVT